MKWLKKWSYLSVFLCVGLVYLTCVDKWQVYARPLADAGAWVEERTGVKLVGLDWLLRDEEAAKEQEELSTDAEHSQMDNIGAEDKGSEEEKPDADDRNGDIGAGETLESGAEKEENAGDIVEAGDEGQEPDEPVDNAEETEAEPGPPVYVTVEDDYFADAVFIGDSRTVGMFEYGGLEEITTFYATEGLSVYEFYTHKFINVPGQKGKVTVEEALQKQSFAKIYVMLGINEMGGNMEKFLEQYEKMVARIQELQPDATIYLQGIMKVSARRDAKGDYINNAGIEARNEVIATFADNRQVFYLDVNPVVCDEGGMIADYTYDGVHLKAKYFELWKQFLKEHAIEAEKEPGPEFIRLE